MHVASRSSTTAVLAVDPMNSTTLYRRGIASLAGGFLVLAAGAVRAARGSTLDAVPMADAGSVRLCAMFQNTRARCEAAPDDGVEWKVWLYRRWEICAAIEGMFPDTEVGRRAKAQVALILMEEAADTENEYERFTLLTLPDLARSAAA